MPTVPLSPHELQRTVDVWLENNKNIKATAKKLGLKKSGLQYRLWKAKALGLVVRSDSTAAAPGRKIYVITAAQDDTPVFSKFWKNLTAYVDARGAELIVGGFTYQKGLFEDHQTASGVFAPEVVPFMLTEKRYLTPKLLYCGHANILPTSPNPLGGWETMSGEAWAIIPHARISLRTVPTMLDAEEKVIMTTGVVTETNYIQRAIGQKSEFHHTFGAVVVEVEEDGTFHCRHLNASKDGSFQDLTTFVEHGKVTEGHTVEAINWGDIHNAYADEAVVDLNWGGTETKTGDSIIGVLQPRYQFMHDVLDFKPRNWHNRNDPHFRAKIYTEGEESVKEELEACAATLDSVNRPYCTTVVIESNHDLGLVKWLKDPSGAFDPANALEWHKWNYYLHSAIRDKNDKYNLFEDICSEYSNRMQVEDVFVEEGDSFKICTSVEAPIECGLHGHVGANGSRGSPTNLSKVAAKLNTGHTHSASILNGVYTAGVSAKLRMGYNERGPSSWSRAHIVTYPNGKRTIVFIRKRVDGSLAWRLQEKR